MTSIQASKLKVYQASNFRLLLFATVITFVITAEFLI
jgi:hypothetical protein